MFDNGGVTRDICKMVDKNNLTEVETKKKRILLRMWMLEEEFADRKFTYCREFTLTQISDILCKQLHFETKIIPT